MEPRDQGPPSACGGPQCQRPPLSTIRAPGFLRSSSAPTAAAEAQQEQIFYSCLSYEEPPSWHAMPARAQHHEAANCSYSRQRAAEANFMGYGRAASHPHIWSISGCGDDAGRSLSAPDPQNQRPYQYSTLNPPSPFYRDALELQVFSSPRGSSWASPGPSLRRCLSEAYFPFGVALMTRRSVSAETSNAHKQQQREAACARFDSIQEPFIEDGGLGHSSSLSRQPRPRFAWVIPTDPHPNSLASNFGPWSERCMATYPQYPEPQSGSLQWPDSAGAETAAGAPSSRYPICDSLGAPVSFLDSTSRRGSFGSRVEAVGDPEVGGGVEAAAWATGACQRDNRSESNISSARQFGCSLKSDGEPSASVGLSRSWTGLPSHSDADLSTLGSRSFSEPLLHYSLNQASERPSAEAMPIQLTLASGLTKAQPNPGSPAFSLRKGGPPRAGALEEMHKTRPGTQFVEGTFRRARGEVEGSESYHDGGIAVSISESLAQQGEASGGAVEMEGFVNGVQSCISRLIKAFPSGFELHNGYGGLVAPDYWTSDAATGVPVPAPGKLSMGTVTGAGYKGSLDPKKLRVSARRFSLPNQRCGEQSAEPSETNGPQGEGGDTAADSEAPEAADADRDVVFSIDVPPPELSVTAATCYYSVEGVVGRGAHGAVFRAKRIVKAPKGTGATRTDPESGNPAGGNSGETSGVCDGEEVDVEEDEVALKIIDLDGALRTQCSDAKGRARYIERVLVEANVLAKIQHENVVKFYETFQWPPCYVVLVTEYLPGGSLRDLYKTAGPLPEPIIAFVLKDVTKALSYLHEARLQADKKYKPLCIHRDIKAANILLTETGRAKLIDFGISSSFTDTDSEFAGTPQWMAPEIAEIFCRRRHRPSDQSEADVQVVPYSCSVDIWSLGITAYELAMGTLPWPNKTKLDQCAIQLMHMIAYGPAPRINLNEGFEKSFCYFVEKCLRKDGGERGTASELLDHTFFTKFCLGKRPQSHQELKEAVETFNGKRHASVLTTVVGYLSFWGKKGSAASLPCSVSKRRMPVGRLEKWGRIDAASGSMRGWDASTAHQKSSLLMMSSSASMMFRNDSSPAQPHQTAGAKTKNNTTSSHDETDINSIPSSSEALVPPGADGGDHQKNKSINNLSFSGHPESLAPQEWPVSASAREGQDQREQNLNFTGEPSGRDAGSGMPEIVLRLPVDESLGLKATENASAKESGELGTVRAQPQNAGVQALITGPPSSSQSFFKLFLSAFQNQAGAKQEKTSTADTVVAAAQHQAALGKRSQDSGVLYAAAQSPALGFPTQGPVGDSQMSPMPNIPMPPIGGVSHPLPRRFRKTRETGNRRRSRHREAKASLSRGADRFFGLLRRLEMVNGCASQEGSAAVRNLSNGDFSDSTEEEETNGGRSSPPDGTQKSKDDVCRGLPLPPNHHGSTKELHDQVESQAAPFEGTRNGVPPSLSGSWELPAGCTTADAEPSSGQQRQNVRGTPERVAPVARARTTITGQVGGYASSSRGSDFQLRRDVPVSPSRSDNFCNMLESPTMPTTGIPNLDDKNLFFLQESDLGNSRFHASCGAPPPRRSHTHEPGLAPETASPICSEVSCPQLTSVHANYFAMRPGGTRGSVGSKEREGLPSSAENPRTRSYQQNISEAHPNVEICPRGSANGEPSSPAGAQTKSDLGGATSEARDWLAGPPLYRRLLNGIAALVEDSVLRQTRSVSRAQEPSAENVRVPIGEIEAGPSDDGDSMLVAAERSGEPQTPYGSNKCKAPAEPPAVLRINSEGSAQPVPVHTSWLWNLISRDSATGAVAKREANDALTVAARHLSEAGLQVETYQTAQAPANAGDELYAPAAQTPRALSRGRLHGSVEAYPGEVMRPTAAHFDESLLSARQFVGTSDQVGRTSWDFICAPQTLETRSSLPVSSRAERARFTTFAEDLELERRRRQAQAARLEQRPVEQEISYAPCAQCPPYTDQVSRQSLRVQLHDAAGQQPVFTAPAGEQWVLPRQHPQGYTQVLGLNSGCVGAFVPNPISAPAGWDEGQQVTYPVVWHDGTVPTGPAQPMTNPHYDVQDVVGPHANQ